MCVASDGEKCRDEGRFFLRCYSRLSSVFLALFNKNGLRSNVEITVFCVLNLLIKIGRARLEVGMALRSHVRVVVVVEEPPPPPTGYLPTTTTPNWLDQELFCMFAFFFAVFRSLVRCGTCSSGGQRNHTNAEGIPAHDPLSGQWPIETRLAKISQLPGGGPTMGQFSHSHLELTTKYWNAVFHTSTLVCLSDFMDHAEQIGCEKSWFRQRKAQEAILCVVPIITKARTRTSPRIQWIMTLPEQIWSTKTLRESVEATRNANKISNKQKVSCFLDIAFIFFFLCLSACQALHKNRVCHQIMNAHKMWHILMLRTQMLKNCFLGTDTSVAVVCNQETFRHVLLHCRKETSRIFRRMVQCAQRNSSVVVDW